MEKHIDMTVKGVSKTELKRLLKESGLKKRLLKGDYSNGIVSVSVKQILPYSKLWKNYSLGISSENVGRALEVYKSIFEKNEEMKADKKYNNITSKLYTNDVYSGTETENERLRLKVDKILYKDVKNLKSKLNSIEAERKKKKVSFIDEWLGESN